MKALRIILTILLVLAIALLILLGVSHYLIWPKPEVLSLVPGTPLAYIAACDLDKTISAGSNLAAIKYLGEMVCY